MINGIKSFIKRATSVVLGHPSDPNKMIFESKGGGFGYLGSSVSANTAMAIPTVFACVNIRAQSVASIPFKLYKRTATGKKAATEDSRYKITTKMFNPRMTSFMGREYMQMCLDLKGNAYAQIVWEDGFPVALYPIDPARVRIKIEKGVKTFIVLQNDGSEKEFFKEEILHLSNISLDGVYGASVLALHREVFNKAKLQSQYSQSMFDNAARPSGAFSVPGELSQEAFDRLKKELKEEWAGAMNAGKPMLLENAMTFVPISMNAEDLAYIDQMKFSQLDICQIFQTPPHMVGILDRATFSNIEEQNTDFYRRTLMAIYVRTEAEYDTTLLTPKEQPKYYFKFDVRAFLRGNSLARYQVYAIARNWGIMSLNEIRELEDMELLPPEIGDVHLEPLNMKRAGEDDPNQQPADSGNDKKDPEIPEGPNKGNGKKPADKAPEKKARTYDEALDHVRESFSRIFEDLIGRAISKHTLNLEKRIPKVKYDHHWRSEYCGFFMSEKENLSELLSAAIAGYCLISEIEKKEEIKNRFIEGYIQRSVEQLDATEFGRAPVKILMQDWMSSRAVNETRHLFEILEEYANDAG